MYSGGWSLAQALHPSTSKQFVLPHRDLTLLGSHHHPHSVFYTFLQLELQYTPNVAYMKQVQTEVTIEMRSAVTEWMFEVCQEERCSCELFPLAVSYLDRFLSVVCIHKGQLQALATACLFLTSKVKLPRPFLGDRLVLYADGGVTVSELLSWELLVLNRLNWDLASLTPFDFLDQYTHRLRLVEDQRDALQGPLVFLVSQAARDFRTALLPPSAIAAVCLHVSLTVVYGEEHVSYRRFSKTLGDTVAVVMDPDKPYAVAVYDMIARYHAVFSQRPSARVLGQLQLPPFTTAFTGLTKNEGQSSSDIENVLVSSAGSTPTDIMDIMF